MLKSSKIAQSSVHRLLRRLMSIVLTQVSISSGVMHLMLILQRVLQLKLVLIISGGTLLF
jgi:hypothetical protein